MKRFYLISALALMVFAGCIKKGDLNFNNLQYTNWSPNWALPFVSTSLTLQNMLNSGTVISTSSNGLLTLNYAAPSYSVQASSFISIPDQHFSTPGFALGVPIASLPTGQTVSDSSSGSFSYVDSNGTQLEHLMLKGGRFHIHLVSGYPENVSLQVTFPNITNNGTPLTTNADIYYSANYADASVDLSGYTLDMTNGGTTQNYLAYKIAFTLSGTGQPISATDSLWAAMEFTGLKFGFIDGYLGHYVCYLPDDTVNVGILNKSVTANVKLLDPKINMNFTSSFGVTVAAQLDSVYGYSTITNAIDTVQVPAMTIQGESAPGAPPAVTNWTDDTTNSNLRNIFSPVPSYMIYNGHLTINPSGTHKYNFVYDTSTITIGASISLPACFQIVQLALQDTMQMLMPADTNILTSVNFAVQVVNSFPVYAAVQLYFTDSNYVILDSLINPVKGSSPYYLISPAAVNSQGIVTSSSTQTTNFIMTQARYTAIASRIRHGIVRGNLLTSGNSFIQLFSTDHLDVKTDFRFQLNYTL